MHIRLTCILLRLFVYAVLLAGTSHVAAGTVTGLEGIFISRRMIMHHDHSVVIQFRCIDTTDGDQ